MGKHKQRATKTYIQEETWGHNIQKYWPYYLIVLSELIYFGILKFIPIFGSIIASEDCNVIDGFFKSPWVGFKNFKALFTYPDFKKILTNTIILGFCETILILPILILLSLMLNEIKQQRLRKGIQTAVYIPYFVSWVIVGRLVFDFFGVGGFFSSLREMIGMKPVLAVQKGSWSRPTFIISSVWKETGQGAVVYLAAISGIDPSLYESASVDGASRFQKIKYVTSPLLVSTMVTLFLLDISSFLELGFDQVYNLQTPTTYAVSDTFDTYVYRVGIQQAQYNFTTAVGLLQSVVGLGFILIFNKLLQKTSEGGLW